MEDKLSTAVIVIALLFLGWGVAQLVPKPKSEHLGMDHDPFYESKSQLFEGLQHGMKSMFPQLEFDLYPDEFEIYIPNDSEKIEGIGLVVSDGFEIMVATGEFVHWHFDKEHLAFLELKGESRANSTLVEAVLEHLNLIFSDMICFYSKEKFGWSESGSYEAGKRPKSLGDGKKLDREWCWSGSLLA